MKFLVVFTIFLLVQTFAAQQLKDDHQPDHINQQHVADQQNKEGHQIQTTITPQTQENSVQHNTQDQQHNKLNNAQHVAQHVAQQSVQNNALHAAGNKNQNNNQNNNQNVNSANENSSVQHPSIPPKVSVQIPSKVQLVVTQVSQHIPTVVAQHVANQNNIQKQRLVRSLVNRLKLVEKPRKCSFECSPTDPQVCAYNGRCYQEFESQCEMSAYNCLNSQKRFHLAHDAECRDSTTVKCYPGDM